MSAVFIEENLSGLLDLEVSPFLPSPSSTAYLPRVELCSDPASLSLLISDPTALRGGLY